MYYILQYLKPHMLRMSLGLTIKVIGTLMDLVLPWILAYILDNVIPQKSITPILLWGGAMIICALIAVLTNVIANRIASRVARNTTEKLRHDLYAKISSLSCTQVDMFSIPSLVSRLTSDTYNIHQFVGVMQRMGVRAPILLIGGIIITIRLEPILASILITSLLVMAFLVIVISKKGIPLYKALQKSIDTLVRTVRENILGIRVIKALSKTEYEKERFSKANSNVVSCEKKAGLTMAILNPAMNLLLNIGLTVVVIVGAYLVNSGESEPGTIIAFMSYFTIILMSMLFINRLFSMYTKASASAQRITEVMNAPDELLLETSDKVDSFYHVEFKHISFSYNKKEKQIYDINFQLKRGETLGIIGATGSGKTTIIQLLMRLYDADQGSIYIDGINIKSIPPEILHTKFGIVFQKDALFADSIAENVSFGRNIADEALTAALKYAQAYEFIDSLDDGMDYRLAVKAANLSGGQKQRLLISRALAGNPEILIFDDSSSALDYDTDARLRKSIAAHFPNTTTLIIAQRISSIKHADHVLVLDAGKTIGYGTHEELLASNQLYREISHSQMGGVFDA